MAKRESISFDERLTDALDLVLDLAEVKLAPFMITRTPEYLVNRLKQAIDTHLTVELMAIKNGPGDPEWATMKPKAEIWKKLHKEATIKR